MIPSRGFPSRSRLPVAVLAGLLLALPALGQQAVVRSYDTPDLEVGQAWLMHSGGRCYAVLPHHVVTETTVPSLLREDVRGLRGEASEVIALGDDAAIAPLSGSIAEDCGYSIGSISRGVGRHLRNSGLGTLRSVNGDGSLGRLAVTIVDDDGLQLLRVMPTIDNERIRKGHSGSLLMVSNQPVGMLLSVHARSGIGTVMRTDALLEKVDGYLRGAPVAAAAVTNPIEGQATTTTTHTPYGTWQITAWNVDPLGSLHIASKLTARGDDGFWAARVERWPATLELGGPENVRVVRGIEFAAGGAEADAARLPAKVQVLTSASTGRRAWRAVSSATLAFTDGVARIEFLPVRARRIRIEIYQSQGSPSKVALGRLRVLEEGQ